MTETFPTLYKIGANGQILQWSVKVTPYVPDSDPYPTYGEIVISHGQADGKIQTDTEMVTEGKNIGRANETSPWDQAVSQAESRWKKQLDNAYRETICEAKKAASASTKPMLAHKLVDKAHKLVVGKAYGEQPKLDGMRCIAFKSPNGEIKLVSRKGKPIESVPHIVAELHAWMSHGDVWDGELYVHGMDFEKNQSICKRKAKNLHPEYASMQYHVFDTISDDWFPTRWLNVSRVLAGRCPGDEMIQVVPWRLVTYENEDQLVALADRYASEGYEGLILRDLETGYEHKLSIQLIKVKRFHDAEFKIVGTEAGKPGTKDEDLLIKFIIEHPEIVKKKETGRTLTCEATLMGTREKRQEMLTRREEYVGQWCTVVFQELSTKCGAPRFAKVKAIREMEALCPAY